MPLECDFLIVGAGFAGCVIAERLATQANKRCLIVDRRNHIGGNAHDSYNRAGVLNHDYGPHYFRTNSDRIKIYLEQFTEWRRFEFKILVWTGGRYWQFPINLNTFEQILGRSSTPEEMEALLRQWRIPIAAPKNSEEVITAQVGTRLFEMFFKNYTRKQWGCEPRDLAPTVCGRIPIRTNRDDRYLEENFQALPKNGYHKMFERMVQNANIRILLKTDYREIKKSVRYRHLIYTGPIDEFYNYCYGLLPYRSLKFEAEIINKEYVLPSVQVNFPNDYAFTRIVEIKHATGQILPATTIVREYPQAYTQSNEPYYPIPNSTNQQIYNKYAERAKVEKYVSFIGRQATYRYYNMDQVVGMALAEWERLAQSIL